MNKKWMSHAKIQNDWKPRKKADIFEKPTGFHMFDIFKIIEKKGTT